MAKKTQMPYNCKECGKRFIRGGRQTLLCSECLDKARRKNKNGNGSIYDKKDKIERFRKYFLGEDVAKKRPQFFTKKENVLYYVIPYLKKNKGLKFNSEHLLKLFDEGSFTASQITSVLSYTIKSEQVPGLKRERYKDKKKYPPKYRFWIE